MTNYPAIPQNISDLSRKAALCERNPSKWQQRFQQLIDTGLVKASVPPGSEQTCSLQVESDLAHCAMDARQLVCQVAPIIRAGGAIGADLTRLTPAALAPWALNFGRLLEKELGPDCLSDRGILLSLALDHPALQDFLRLRGCSELGYPRLAIRFDARRNAISRKNWLSLVTLSHRDPRIHLIPSMIASPWTRLHVSERGQSVMPVSLFEVRARTAWMVFEIDATRLTAPDDFRSQLRQCLRFADNLIDIHEWPQSALRLDALLNRRVAIHLSGLGQMILQEGADPADFTTLKRLQRWLRGVRNCLFSESNQLARKRGSFPAFGTHELVASLEPSYGVAEASKLVRNRSMRHRHLFTLSPFSVFPDIYDIATDEHWLNLLPAIGCADTLSMFGKDPRSRIGLKAWARLLEMTGALASGTSSVT